MTFTSRDRRALHILLFVIVALALRWVTSTPSSNPKSNSTVPSLPAERLLTGLAARRKAAGLGRQKVEVLQEVTKELAELEHGLIQADTAAQAQAQLLQVLKNVMGQQQPPLEVKEIDFSSPRQVSDAYGQVSVSITMECTIDELLNLVADLTAQSIVIATDEISLVAADPALKTLRARLTVTGLVRRTLITQPRNPQT
jgi:hypothetical protein